MVITTYLLNRACVTLAPRAPGGSGAAPSLARTRAPSAQLSHGLIGNPHAPTTIISCEYPLLAVKPVSTIGVPLTTFSHSFSVSWNDPETTPISGWWTLSKRCKRRDSQCARGLAGLHWWEQPLHNQTALRLKAALWFHPGIVVANVPHHMAVKPL
jgi:hypothetical protein